MFPGLPRFSRSSASVYYTERKPKNKKRGRPGNDANPWVQRLFQKSCNYCPSKIFHAQLFHTFSLLCTGSQLTVFYSSSPVLEINKAICGWILEQDLLLALPRQSHTHHIMTFRAFARYCCDDGATVSREKSFQAFPLICLQSCKTKSGTERLGSKLERACNSQYLLW